MMDVIASHSGTDLQSIVILKEVKRRLGARSVDEDQAILTYWHELMRTGVLAWGYDIANANPPWVHLTARGRKTLQAWSRDPANPDGYLAALEPALSRETVSWSYVAEALATYNSGCHKASAVMVGAAGEALVLELRDDLVARLAASSVKHSRDLTDWRIKKVLDALEAECSNRAKTMPPGLDERFRSYWSSFTAHLRLARNDAGHPKSIEPVTLDVVHGSLLIFPELVKLVAELRAWVKSPQFV
jgi:hypothetical protein